MNYPTLEIPYIGSSWFMGIIATFHIWISHFAVGGGIYLVVTEMIARRDKNQDWIQLLKGQTRFFIILTAALGAISGVGIWFTIGLINPQVTSALIHNFVFAWACEWVFFIIEIAAIIVYYYTWDRLDAKTHIRVGWIYAISAWMSLFIINGILCFMLTPGEWIQTRSFYAAFFNPTYWPLLTFRTLFMLAMAGVWFLAATTHYRVKWAGKINEENIIKMTRWLAAWVFPLWISLPLMMWWFVSKLPFDFNEIFKLGISGIGPGNFSVITRMIIFFLFGCVVLGFGVWLTAYLNAHHFVRWHGIVFLALCLALVGAGEMSRELLRKPYTIGNSGQGNGFLYVSGVRVGEEKEFNDKGYLYKSIWAPEIYQSRNAQFNKAKDKSSNSNNTLAIAVLDKSKTFDLSIEQNNLETSSIVKGITDKSTEIKQVNYGKKYSDLSIGKSVFYGQCMNCHTKVGYRGVYPRLAGRDREGIRNLMLMLWDPIEYEKSIYKRFMPPMVGNEMDFESLVDWLDYNVNKPAETQNLVK